MYLDCATLHTIRRLSFGNRGGGRFFVLSQAIFQTVRGLIEVGRRLDDWLYPAYARQGVEQPVFIFAPPRSGTTLLHRLLCQDEERFTHARLYQTLLQSVTLTRVVERVAALDRPLGGALSRAVERADARFFGPWSQIHPMGLNQAEEDEGYFIFSLLSPGAFVFYPWVDDLPRAAWLDAVEEPARKAVMAEYRANVQRHLFATGGDRTWLNKTVLLASRLQSVTQTFPDARFIHLVRTPYETVPSFASMFTTFWPLFYPEAALDSEHAHQVARLAIEYTRKSLELRHRLGSEQYLTVRYTDLVADPRRVVEDIYRHFAWDISEAFARRLDAQIVAARCYRPQHEYSLEQFGLTRRIVYDELRQFFDEFGFDPLLEEEDDWIEDDALDAV